MNGVAHKKVRPRKIGGIWIGDEMNMKDKT